MKLLTICLGIVLMLSLTVVNVPASRQEWKSNYSKAEALMVDGQFSEASNCAKLSLIESVDRHGSETLNSVKSLELLAQLAQATGKIPQALRLQARAYDLVKRLKGVNNPNTVNSLCRLAQLATLSGNLKIGETYYREALAMCQGANRQGCITATVPIVGLAQVLVSESRYAEAEELYLSAIDRFSVFSKYRPALKVKMAEALESLGAMYATAGAYSNAAGCYSKSEKIYRSQRVVPLEQLGQTLFCLGNTYSKLGKPERSLKCYKEAIGIFEYEGKGSPSSLGLVYKGLGDIFRAKGNLKLAADYYNKAVIQLQTVDFVGKPLFSDTIKCLSEVYLEMGMDSEANMIQSKLVAMN